MSSLPVRLPATSLLALSACVNSYTATTTGPKLPPRPTDCDFEVYTAAPSAGSTEIGTIDVAIHDGGAGAGELAPFKAAIRPYVCQMGGDAAFAQANGFGHYVKATVLKAGGPATAPAPAAAAGGCSFDTQCKGDRICVKGACVDPPTSKAPSSAL